MRGRKLVVFCDGTTMKGKKGGTNVWAMMGALGGEGALDMEQRPFYVPGIGTGSSQNWINGLAAVFGWGLKARLAMAYEFLCLNWSPGSEIHMYGFSRGAYTARCLAGIVCRFGIVPDWCLLSRSPIERRRWLGKLVAAYRSEKRLAAESAMERLREHGLLDSEVEFVEEPGVVHLGMWDCVAAVGFPWRWMQVFSDVWCRKLFKRRLWGLHDNKLSRKVGSGYHALALDEEREPFLPNRWAAADNVREVWFAGCHGDVGGGEIDPGLSRIPLLEMIAGAKARGLKFHRKEVEKLERQADATAAAHDSRGTAQGFLLSYRVRDVDPFKDEIHPSVGLRMENGVDGYSPKAVDPPRWSDDESKWGQPHGGWLRVKTSIESARKDTRNLSLAAYSCGGLFAGWLTFRDASPPLTKWLGLEGYEGLIGLSGIGIPTAEAAAIGLFAAGLDWLRRSVKRLETEIRFLAFRPEVRGKPRMRARRDLAERRMAYASRVLPPAGLAWTIMAVLALGLGFAVAGLDG